MFKFFTKLYANDTYHIVEPGGTKNFFKEVLMWIGLIIWTILFTAVTVITTLILKPLYVFTSGLVRAALAKNEAD